MNRRTRILVSWVGHADLLGWAALLEPAQRTVVEQLTGRAVSAGAGVGPVRAAVEAMEFDQVHLIGDFEPTLLTRFGDWLGANVKTHPVTIEDPTDYRSVFEAAQRVLLEICAKRDRAAIELWIALSSGTPAMAATLVLLGKSLFPARFLQSFRGAARETDVPFDLTVDFLPDLLKDPDAHLQRLADKSPSEVPGFDAIVGQSRAIRLAVGRAKRAAIRDVSVLILGESGTGKELFARAIHAASRRCGKPFRVVNCAAIPPDLQESILFGHRKGAFTDAKEDRAGEFRMADGGTLFLDEFGELDLRTQATLLRALQPTPHEPSSQRTFRPLGATTDETADVRIVAATNRDPQEQLKRGLLREDLLYRVATFSLVLPPLRHRRSDIPAICESLLARVNDEFEKGEPGYEHKRPSPSAIKVVTLEDWPGNVRQLNNVLVQAAVLSDGSIIGKADVEAAIAQLPATAARHEVVEGPLGDGFSLPAFLADVERRYIRRAYEESDGVKTKAAKLLGLKSYQALDAKLKKLRIRWAERGDR